MKHLLLPPKLRDLLADSRFEPATMRLVNEVGVLLQENSMPFFPAFTDHGTEHVEHTLEAVVQLIPDEVWEDEILEPADAAVLICSTLLHDIGMHIHPVGFAALVGGELPHRPCPWFDRDQGERPADKPWDEQWREFRHEARHFGTTELERLFGPGSSVPTLAYEEELDHRHWTPEDHLLIGEFVRRHHARLSHEIALYGLPGVGPEHFSVLAETMPELAGSVGLVARSHNEPLRLMLECLDYLEEGSKRPGGALLPYHMGLLRVADYLQLEAERAPLLLLELKDPPSPISVEEWNKHGAIPSISEHDDPQAIYVRVSPRHGLRTHLALRTLLENLQRELDTTTAVLSEVYPMGRLSVLRLTRQRVSTNLDKPSLCEQLPYIARAAKLRSDPDLFRLVVKDLYGQQPAVTGRELVQNAVDAVRARWTFEEQQGAACDPKDLRQLEADVVVSVEEDADGQWLFRVVDRGIGMTPDRVVDYFLQAGASFGPTSEELRDLSSEEAMSMMRAGRFGIGAFAAFLLGPEVRVTTRHVGEEKGVSFAARIDGDLVQLDRVDAPIGTEVAIPFDPAVIPGPAWSEDRGTPEELLNTIAGFYRLARPTIAFELHSGGEERAALTPQPLPLPIEAPSDGWRSFEADGFDGIVWRVGSDRPMLVHNGIEVEDLAKRQAVDPYFWSSPALTPLLTRPDLGVFDSRHSLGLALHRYGLLLQLLPFESELVESIGRDIVAHGLFLGSGRHPVLRPDNASVVFTREAWMPFLPGLLHRYLDGPLLVHWRVAGPERLSPDRSPDRGLILGPESPISWEEFPYRMEVSVPYGERKQLSGNATSTAHALGTSTRTNVVVVEGVDNPDPPRKYPLPSPRIHPGAESGPGDRVLEGALRKAGRLLLPNGTGTVGLSAFDPPHGVDPLAARLSAPWEETIGGMLPRSLELCREKGEALAAVYPELKALGEAALREQKRQQQAKVVNP